MKIWIFQTGEPLHSDPQNLRAMRAMNLANYLCDNGHNVTIWSSNFFHQTKKHRFKNETELQIHKSLKINFIHSPGYQKNIGFGRLYDPYVG